MIDLFKKILMNGFGSLSLKISSVILNIYVARTSTVEIYSLYAILTSSIVLFGTTYLNVISQLCSSRTRITSSYLYPNIFTGCYILLICTFLYYFYEENTKYIIFIALICIVLSAPLLGELYKKEKHKVYALFCSISFVTFIVFLFLDYFLLSPSIYHYIILYATPYFMLLILLVYHLYSDSSYKNKPIASIKFELTRFSEFSSQSLYLLSASAIVPLCFWMIYNIFNYNLGAYTIAIFVTMMQWSWIISQFSVVAGNVLISKIKSTKANEISSVSILNIYSAWLPASCAVGFLMSIHEIHELVFGEVYYNNEMLLSYFIVLTVSVLNAFKSFIYRILISANKNYLSLYSNSLWLLLFVGGVYFFNNITLLDFALLYLFSSFASFIFMLPVYLKYNLFSFSQVFFTKPSIYLFSFSIICFLNGYFIDHIIIRLICFIFVCVSLLVVFYKNIKKGLLL